MAALSLVFDLIGRDVSASKAFNDVGNAADKAGKQGANVGSLISGGMKLAAGALIGGGIIEGFKSLYDAAAESAKIGRITTQVIQSTGGAAKISADQVGALATAISNKTGVDDEAIQSGANLLLTFTNIKNEAGAGNDIFNQTTQIMTDMSAALGTDASGSAIQLGKALNDPIKGITALQKVGVSFTDSQKDQIKALVETGNTMGAQKVILQELSREFGGAAAAASTPFDKLQVTLGNLAEQLGGYLIPIVDKFATFLLQNVLPTVSDVAGVVGDGLGTAFSLAGDALGAIVSVGQGAVDFFNSLPGPVQVLVGALGLLAAAKLTGVFSTLASLGETIALKMLYATGAVTGMTGAMAGLKAVGSGLLDMFGGPWGLAIAGVAAAVYGLVSLFNQESDATKNSREATRNLTDALRESNGVIDESVRKRAAQSAQQDGLFEAAQRWGVSTRDVTDAILGNGDAMARVQAGADAYRGSIGGVVGQYGNLFDATGTAQKQSDGWLATLQGLNGTTSTTTQAQRDLAAATGITGAAAAGATPPVDGMTQALENTSKAADDAKKQTDLFKTSLDLLTGAHVSTIQAESAFQGAIASATSAITKEGGAVLDASGQLNLHTENGRKTADSLISLQQAGNQVIATMEQQGATTGDVQAKDAELRQSFYDTALQMTGSKKAAELLTNQIYGIPTDRTVTIGTETNVASQALRDLQAEIDDMRGKNIAITVSGQGGLATYTTEQRNLLYSGIPGKATGGPIFGPGSGTSDTAGLFALSHGEWVVKAASSAKYGPKAMASINDGTAMVIPGLAAGGPIGVNVNIDETGVDAAVDAIKRTMQAAFSGGGSAGGNPAMRALGQQIAANMGWASQFAAIDFVFSHESGWNPNAQNPTSTAYGIPQFLNGTWAQYGGKTSSPGLQITDGINYMVDRYGSPNGAAAFWQGHHWYDGGGWLQPGVTIAHNDTGRPERIRTAEQESALGGGTTVLHVYDVNNHLIGTMRAQAAQVVGGLAAGVDSHVTYSGAGA